MKRYTISFDRYTKDENEISKFTGNGTYHITAVSFEVAISSLSKEIREIYGENSSIIPTLVFTEEIGADEWLTKERVLYIGMIGFFIILSYLSNNIISGILNCSYSFVLAYLLFRK